MADNTTLSAAVGTGDVIRDLAEVTTGVKWPTAVACYATTISAGANVLQIVDATHGLPVAVVGTVTVSAASLPLPSGAATSANQSTEIASLASIDGKLPALGQALAAASVPVVLTAAQLSTLTPTATSTSGRQDTGNASLASIDGKLPALGQALAAASAPVVLTAAQLTTLTPLTTVGVTGTFWQATQPVSLASVPSHAVTNAGTFAVQESGAALTALQNLVFGISVDKGTYSPGTNFVYQIGAAYDDISPDVATEGKVGMLRMSSRRELYSQLRDAAGNERGANVNASNELLVALSSVPSHAVTNAGTFAVQAAQSGTWNVGTVTTVTTLTTCSTLTGSGVAHDAADSGNPHKIGARATTALHSLTLVADADRTDLLAGVDGVQIVRENSNLESLISGTASVTDGSSTSVVASAGAGVRNYITDVSIANTSATTVTVDIRDGTAGSVLWTFIAPAGGGVVHRFASPLRGTAATAVAADPSAAASTVTISLGGFKSKV